MSVWLTDNLRKTVGSDCEQILWYKRGQSYPVKYVF